MTHGHPLFALALLGRRFREDESAATAIEYGLIAGLISVVIIGAVSKLGKDISAKFNAIAANLS